MPRNLELLGHTRHGTSSAHIHPGVTDSPINGNATLVRIRGVGISTAGIAFDPGVGIYVDGVFLPRALGSLMDLVDVGQIEVLRGP